MLPRRRRGHRGRRGKDDGDQGQKWEQEQQEAATKGNQGETAIQEDEESGIGQVAGSTSVVRHLWCPRQESNLRHTCRSLGISRSRYYELRKRYLAYGEAGLLPKPRPAERPDRWLSAPLVDQIIAYAINHPTVGPRTIAAALALPRFGAWSVSHGGVSGVLGRAGLSRMSARLAAAEALSATEGGPITERALQSSARSGTCDTVGG